MADHEIKIDGDGALAARIIAEIDTIQDPCMQAAGMDLSLLDLGLIRRVTITDEQIELLVGLSEPGCGFTHVVSHGLHQAAGKFADGREVTVNFEWRDLWTEDRMNDKAKSAFADKRDGIAERFKKRGMGLPAYPDKEALQKRVLLAKQQARAANHA